MKALVTGHTGFIGKNLVQGLRSRGWEVTGYSRSKGQDILNMEQLMEATRGVDVVYNLAAYAKPAESVLHPAEAVEQNVMGGLNVLEASRKNDFAVIYPSTCEIYGDSLSPITEEYPINPPNPYAASKAAIDRLCYTYSKVYGIHSSILRLFNPYGPHQQLNKIISAFYRQASKGESITVYGDGTDTRDYTYVSDITNALLLSEKLAPGEAINVCTGRAVSGLDVANLIKELTKSKSPIVFAEYPRLFGGYKNQIGSNAKALKLLGWKPQVDFTEGLKLTLDWLAGR